jgi:hypothetical protein
LGQALVDGKQVYFSPDFPASQTVPFRETLLWDESSRFVILEVCGRRLFGYDTQNQTKLTGQQLMAIPIPEAWIPHLEHEGFWPEDENKEASNNELHVTNQGAP